MKVRKILRDFIGWQIEKGLIDELTIDYEMADMYLEKFSRDKTTITKDQLREYLFWQKSLPINLKNSLDATHLIEMYFNRDNGKI